MTRLECLDNCMCDAFVCGCSVYFYYKVAQLVITPAADPLGQLSVNGSLTWLTIEISLKMCPRKLNRWLSWSVSVLLKINECSLKLQTLECISHSRTTNYHEVYYNLVLADRFGCIQVCHVIIGLLEDNLSSLELQSFAKILHQKQFTQATRDIL